MIFIILFFVFTKEILTSYAEFFTINSATKGADLILILSGNPQTRPAKAIELIKDGYSSKLMVTNEKVYAQKHKELIRSDTDLVLEIVKSSDLNISILPSTKGGATSTFDEAYDLITYLKKYKLKHIILVTDKFHTRRAYYAFNKIFAKYKIEGIKLEIAGANNAIYSENNWWTKERGISSYILEPIKFLFYIFNSKNYEGVEER